MLIDRFKHFYPEADGSIGSIGINGNRYYYVRNAQNDIIGITDKTGAFVARYTYDEWGNITSITDGNGYTALIAAAKSNKEDAVLLLLELGADAGLTDSNGKTALDYAKETGNETIISLLEQE